MNARKSGALRALSIKKWIGTNTSFMAFVNGMKISDYDHEMMYGDKKAAGLMKQEELTKHFHFKLEYLDASLSSLGGFYFNPKTIVKQLKPEWSPLQYLSTMTGLEVNFRGTELRTKDMELFAHVLGANETGECKWQTLDLSRNRLTKEGAKFLAPAIEVNKSLVSLDLSGCKLGVSGVKTLAASLQKNSTLKNLNLFRNILDVDGARALGATLKVNSSLEMLDIGHNRIRITGLKSIVDGVLANPNSKLQKLAIRANFITDDGFSYLFDKLVIGAKQ